MPSRSPVTRLTPLVRLFQSTAHDSAPHPNPVAHHRLPHDVPDAKPIDVPDHQPHVRADRRAHGDADVLSHRGKRLDSNWPPMVRKGCQHSFANSMLLRSQTPTTYEPTSIPTGTPTIEPSVQPTTYEPTFAPTLEPSTEIPTMQPSTLLP